MTKCKKGINSRSSYIARIVKKGLITWKNIIYLGRYFRNTNERERGHCQKCIQREEENTDDRKANGDSDFQILFMQKLTA